MTLHFFNNSLYSFSCLRFRLILKLHHIPLTFNTSIGMREENKKKINIPSILLFGSLNRDDGRSFLVLMKPMFGYHSWTVLQLCCQLQLNFLETSNIKVKEIVRLTKTKGNSEKQEAVFLLLHQFPDLSFYLLK